MINGEKLTNREIEVYNLIKKCYTNQEIANKLFLAKDTIVAHANRIFSKTCKNRRQIIAENEKQKRVINVSDQKFEVIKLLEKGYSNKQIAEKLYMSERAVIGITIKLFKTTKLRRNEFILYDFYNIKNIEIDKEISNKVENRMSELNINCLNDYVKFLIVNDLNSL